MIRLIWNNAESRAEISRDGGPIELSDDLTSAVLVSLFSDAESPPDGRSDVDAERRGWWGDSYRDDPAQRTGSLIWTRQGLPNSTRTRTLVEGDIRRCLAWMTSQGIARAVNAIVEKYEYNTIAFQLEITKSTGERWVTEWEATLAAA